MQLEKVVQSSIKGPILISEAFPCFTVLVIQKINSNSIKVHALLDSEATACFMDKDFVYRHKLSFVTKKYLIPIMDPDGYCLDGALGLEIYYHWFLGRDGYFHYAP